MIARQRTLHRFVWLLLAPLLLGLVLWFSQPDTNLSPANTEIPTVPGKPQMGVLP